MKRFFCSICRKVKRVRKYPTNVVSVHADDVYARVGTCNKHDDVLHIVKSTIQPEFSKQVVNMMRKVAK